MSHDLENLVERGLVAYFTPFLSAGLEPGDAPPLEGAELREGHADEKQPNDKPVVVITCTNLGGELAYAGNYEAEVQIRIETSIDEQGGQVHGGLCNAILALLAPEHTEAVLSALRSIPGLGVSCFELDYQARTREARDAGRRRHGKALPYRFLVHRV